MTCNLNILMGNPNYGLLMEIGSRDTALPRAVKITLVLEYPIEKDITDTASFTTVVQYTGERAVR